MLKQAHKFLEDFAVPLVMGILVAMILANMDPNLYTAIKFWKPFGDSTLMGHDLDLVFIVNDLTIMPLFFGIATKELVEAVTKGGDLHPPKKAANVFIATLGGVLGPVFVFGVIGYISFRVGAFGETPLEVVSKGAGIGTATDIAIAWTIAKLSFGEGHPAVKYLLMLAMIDDGIGLFIIAIFYGDPAHPFNMWGISIIGAGILVALVMRLMGVKKWYLYVSIAGPIVWAGMMVAHLHPALTLTVVIPFMPREKDHGPYVDHADDHSTMGIFEHMTKPIVTYGLFLFALTQAGIQLGSIGMMTWAVLGSLVIGKTVFIFLGGLLAHKLGWALPEGMRKRDLLLLAFMGGIGLTVALFVCTAAFTDPELLAQGKMGALLSGFVAIIALVIARLGGFYRPNNFASPEAEPAHA